MGFSLGASLAGAFAGHEPRLKAVVVMGGYAELSRSWPLRRSDAYAAALREFDSVRSIGRSKASWLLQFARNDAFVAPENGEQLLAAAPEPKKLRWYATGHSFNHDARVDRLAWLGERLGFAPPDVSNVELPLAQRIRFRLLQPLARLLLR